MWKERATERPDYARMVWVYRQHHERFRRYVKTNGLLCQACGGMGEFDSHCWYEPPEPCGWCETTGKVTRHLRGEWLRMMREEKVKRS